MVFKDSSEASHRSGEQPDSGRSGANEADAGQLSRQLWQAPGVGVDELQFMNSRGGVANAQEAQSIKSQMSKFAADPEQALLSAVEKSRVVGISDLHVRHAPYFQYLIDEMPKLKQAGVTDMAVEIPKQWQPNVDRWAQSDKDFMRQRLTDGDSLLNLVDAAKQAGIKVNAVDLFYQGSGDSFPGRDAAMATNIKDILKDDQAKVLYLVGAEHLMRGNRVQTGSPSTAELLRQDGVSMTTFYQQMTTMPDGLMMSTRNLTKPISVDTTLADSMAKVKTAGVGLPPYGNWDNVLFYPPHYKMEKVESEFARAALPAKQQLLNSVRENQVVLLGEMKRNDPEAPVSQNRKFMAEMIPELKRAGITDLALDIPADFQKRLDQIAKTGIPRDSLGLGAQFGPSFKPLLQAALKAKIRLHAVGQTYDDTTPVQTLLDGLTNRAAEIEHQHKNAKTLLWTDDLFAANFVAALGKVSVADSLERKGIKATSFADFSQTYDKFSPSLLNGLVKSPVVLDPNKTTLNDVLNPRTIPMERYDHVIVYPIK